jgi:hypothetical protein
MQRPADRLQGLLQRPWWMLPVMGLVAMLPIIVRRVGDPDYWWHELTGQLMWTNKVFARSEMYTYTVPGRPWTDHEYLSQFLYYFLNRAGGLVLVSIGFSIAIWAGFWLVFARIRQREYSPSVAGAALLLGAAAGFVVWGPRPQVFDFLFVSLELYWIERFLTRGSRALYAMPVVTVVWANLHGGFVFSMFFLALALVAVLLRWLTEGHARVLLQQAKRLVVIAAACAVASLVTPYGFSLFGYVWSTQFSSQLAGFVTEWQSPDFHRLDLVPLEAMLLLLLVGFAWRRPRLHDVLYVVASTVLALHAVRFIPILVATATPIVAWQWSEPWARLRAWLRTTRYGGTQRWAGEALAMVLIAGTAGAAGIAAYTLHGQAGSTRANYPVAAADWLTANPQVGTRLFNEYSWGGYVTSRFYPTPQRRVFIYGESELMGDTLLAQYADVNQLHPNWAQVLDSYSVDYILFPDGKPLDAALHASQAWQCVYQDSVASIFVRAPTPLPAAC